MTTAPLDRDSADPLYLQIAEALRREILGHDLAPGSTLPSEAALQEQFGVARSVVRQAVGRLADEGLVVRRQGAPSVVAPPAEHRRLVQRTAGMFDQFARAGHRLRTRVDLVAPDEPPPDAAAFLGTHDTLRIERMRSVGDEPLSYVRTWLPRSSVPELDPADLEDASLHRLLTDRHGLRPRSGRRQIRSVAADERLAAALGVEPGAPLLLLEGESVDQHGRPLEWFTTWHRADKVVFDVDVTDAAEVVTVDRADRTPVPSGPPDLDRARALLAELQELLGEQR
ncbi:GntR family transcriptional regulator [Solicola sp. PLA-1-18]|uniref:GntR family transcriptional regulator n=1 Tax=Solicola sp. PLA-1-18 TaxID=3380532 RepID=UPI003B811495